MLRHVPPPKIWKVKVYMKLFLFIFGAWLIVYFLWKALTRYTDSIKFEINKYENVNYFLYNHSRQSSFAYNLLPETDYNRLINISFEFSIINFPCENVKLLLLILIHSSPTNFAKRKIIRDTWGKNDEDVKVLFLMGSASSQVVKENLQTENSLHKDIIQGSFQDTYSNLTYKHMMALKYVVYHCPDTKYVLKTDDDVFVNRPLMKNFLINDLSPFGAQKLLMCPVVHKAKPFRTYRSKWRVSFDEYQYNYYPTYCLGWSILYSPDIIFDLYKEGQRSIYFWIDDVYITGIVADKINIINHIDIFALTLTTSEIRSIINFSHEFKPFLFGSADMNGNDILSLWKYVISNPVPDSIRQ
ncbi:hypothetical protein NQ314_017104 [Rhamnusium bicolor]|uniref:Hexosyltransferase n=1 Tax=Rhamnusium bicolor TaxID=1586634 RepID=A0AAV8WUT4_9CUCU|nr:hypothetical protein NQ314_017104 [Rhamnusium bicolor]